MMEGVRPRARLLTGPYGLHRPRTLEYASPYGAHQRRADDDHRSRIVFITRGLDRKVVEDMLTALTTKEASTERIPEA